MNSRVEHIIREGRFDKERLVELLSCGAEDSKPIFLEAAKVKKKYIGDAVHLRGLIELSNICSKNCLYCGIRRDNKSVKRYSIGINDVEKAIQFAIVNNFGSIVIQSGEITSGLFARQIEQILIKATCMSQGKLGITLSCGEQSKATYERWKIAGAHRYLLRIESSNKKLYYKIHPNNQAHNFENRLQSLTDLQSCGYQTGTGIMIGLPEQSLEDLANDLCFMRELDIDMCGMGPYVEHEQTPLYMLRKHLLPKSERVFLTLKMIALLRIMMKDINIASTTALQAMVDGGREKALRAGANILMPNITPGCFRDDYALYQNKPGTQEEAEDSKINMDALIKRAGCYPAYGEKGNSQHFAQRQILS